MKTCCFGYGQTVAPATGLFTPKPPLAPTACSQTPEGRIISSAIVRMACTARLRPCRTFYAIGGFTGSAERLLKRVPGKETAGPSTTLPPVGMTISLWRKSFSVKSEPRNKIVIPTGAYPDFLLRAASDEHVCGSPQREPHADHQRHTSREEIRGSVVEGPAVSFPGTHIPRKPSFVAGAVFVLSFPRLDLREAQGA
jgi:hypothetical protein